MSPGHLLLIGAGHAHLFVLEALIKGKLRPGRATVVAPYPSQVYSGMVPGFVEGRYRLEELCFDLPALTRAAGAEFIPSTVTRIDAAARQVELGDGRRVGWDVASVAIGGMPGGSDLPGVSQHARFVKPIDRVVELPAALDRLAQDSRPEPRRLVVVGAGAAGIELALTSRARLDRAGAGDVGILLLDRLGELLGGRNPAGADLIHRLLQRRDIRVRLGSAIAEVGPDFVRLGEGRVLPADLVIWAAGTAAPPLFAASRLPTDPRGFLLVEDTLQAAGVPGLFGAGDAVTLAGAPGTPKAGVYAVRMGPVLARNLGAALAGPAGQLVPYRPQPRFLALLNTGDGRAVLSYGNTVTWGRWAMWLKDWIDRGFMRRFQRLG